MQNNNLTKLIKRIQQCRKTSTGRVIFDNKTTALAIEAIQNGCRYTELVENCSVSASTASRWFKLAKENKPKSPEIKIQRSAVQTPDMYLHHNSGWHIKFTNNDDVIEFIKKLDFLAVS